MLFCRCHARINHQLVKLSREGPDFATLFYRCERSGMQGLSRIIASAEALRMPLLWLRKGNNLPPASLAGKKSNLVVLQVEIRPWQSREIAQSLAGVQAKQN